MVETSRREHGRPEVWRSGDLKRLFDFSYHALVGPDELSAGTNNCSFENVVQTGWALCLGFSQLNVLDVAHIKDGLTGLLAEHHLLDSQVVTNTYFVRTHFDSFNIFCVRFCDVFFFFFHKSRLLRVPRIDFSDHIHV